MKKDQMKKEKTLLENIRWFYFFCVGLVGYSCRGVIIILGAYEKKRSQQCCNSAEIASDIKLLLFFLMGFESHNKGKTKAVDGSNFYPFLFGALG